MNGSLKKPCSGEKEREERAESRLVPLFDWRAPGFAKQTDGDVRKAKHTTSLVKLPERSGLRICKALKLFCFFFSGERPSCTDAEHTVNSFRTPAKHIIFTFDLEHTRPPPPYKNRTVSPGRTGRTTVGYFPNVQTERNSSDGL